MKYCQLTLELATPAGDTKAQSNALHRLAWIRWRIGEYAAARALASEAQRVSHISADLYREAQALQIGAICRTEVGDYAQGLAACIRARALLAACGMAGGDMEHALMASQAEVHKWKSEYEEARGIHVQVLEEASRTQNAYHHAYALVNLVEVDVLMGRPTDAIQQNLDKARGMFEAVGDAQAIKWADAMEGDLAFLQGDKMRARTLLQDGVRFAIGTNVEMALYCLDRLADVRRWGGSAINSSWPTVYLLQTLKVKNTLGIHRALQLLEDVFLAQGEIATAANLLSVALKAFTFMDVHRSRAQCMLRLGDIAHKDGDPRRALKLLEEARPLLKRSSQGKDAEDLEQRISAAVNPKV
ncbi:hypothetical protein C8R46DRAFT_1040987 [Mycena filopes]|nr:hypothetical protein C8R46DRAFT_1040987 [Mycena filopes]